LKKGPTVEEVKKAAKALDEMALPKAGCIVYDPVTDRFYDSETGTVICPVKI